MYGLFFLFFPLWTAEEYTDHISCPCFPTRPASLFTVLLPFDSSTEQKLSSCTVIGIRSLWTARVCLFVYNFVSDYLSHLQRRYHRSKYAAYVDSCCMHCPVFGVATYEGSRFSCVRSLRYTASIQKLQRTQINTFPVGKYGS